MSEDTRQTPAPTFTAEELLAARPGHDGDGFNTQQHLRDDVHIRRCDECGAYEDAYGIVLVPHNEHCWNMKLSAMLTHAASLASEKARLVVALRKATDTIERMTAKATEVQP
jgi:hypothetical protein